MSGKRKKAADSLPSWAQEPEALPDWAQEPTPNIQEDWGDAANSGASVQQPPVGPESVAAEAYGPHLPDPNSAYAKLKALQGGQDAFARGGLMGSTFNWANRAEAGMESLFPRLQLPPEQFLDPRVPTPPARPYSEALADYRNLYSRSKAENPGDFRAGNLVGGFAASSALPAGAASAAAQGAAAGLGATEDLTQPEAVRDTAVGGLLGYGLNQLGEGVGGLATKGVSRLARGFVEPSAAARYLQSKGVNNLTIAQMAPGSKLAQLEEAATFSGGAGPGVRAMRDAGKQSWQTAAANEALAPGMAKLPMGTAPADAQQAIAQGFNAAYDVAKGHPVAPDTIQSALYAVDDPSIYATDGARATVAKFIRNQITALRQSADGAVDSGDVIALRSTLRARIRALTDATDGTSAQERDLFQAVADELSNVLDAQLPPKAADMLRAADEQYGNFVTLGQAVRSAKDMPSGFSPTHLQNAVASRTPNAVYEAGGGGPLRAMSQAGKATFDMQSPPTGAIAMVTGFNPVVPWVTGPAMLLANQPGPKAFLTGNTGWQQALSGSDWFQSIIQQQPEALGQYLGTLSAAAARSPEALGQVHNQLSETDPEYQQRMRALGGQSQ